MFSKVKKLAHRRHDDGASRNTNIPDGQAAPPASPYDRAVVGAKPTEGAHPVSGKINPNLDESNAYDSGSRRDQEGHALNPIAENSTAYRGSTIIPVRSNSNTLPNERNQNLPAEPIARRNYDEKVAGSYLPSSKNLRYAQSDSPMGQTRENEEPNEAQLRPDSTRMGSKHKAHPVPGRPQARNPRDRSNNDPNTTIQNANSNSEETHVTEYISPAVTHETITREIHHVREERITKEIHEHEVYHRVLPIVEVEVLPTRHFLPTENDGLVEIDPKHMQSRKKNWAITPTGSHATSDMPVTAGRRQFSAGQFADGEGEARRYLTSDGTEKTEQTWIHPPELETGAQKTGQTRPMELNFGDLSLDDGDDVQASQSAEGPNRQIPRKPVRPT